MLTFCFNCLQSICVHSFIYLSTVTDPGFANGGTDHVERAEREPKRGSGSLGAESPAGSRD